ncbi:MAG: hypothetical protein U5Q16_05410 [Gammaproteobacteria bacterium]|nr:hypothetical protein [Gammaproteobacteria bacterium]
MHALARLRIDPAEALEFATQPHPRSVEELSEAQLEDYRGMREAGLPHQEAFDYATAPVGPSGAADGSGSELGDADSVRAEQQDAAAARRRAVWLRADGAAGGRCMPDAFSGDGEPVESPWTLDWSEPGLGWAAETATLLNTAASAGGEAVAASAAASAGMSAEEAGRYLAAFGASEALRLKGHAIAEARRLFAAARRTAIQQLEGAEAAGQNTFVADIERYLANLERLESDWLALQHRLEAGLRRELDTQLAANAETGLGPANGEALVRALVEYGVKATGTEHHLIEVRARVGSLIRGAAGSRTDEFGVVEFLGEVESSVDRAIPTPIELVTDPSGTLGDYGDFFGATATSGTASAARPGTVSSMPWCSPVKHWIFFWRSSRTTSI